MDEVRFCPASLRAFGYSSGVMDLDRNACDRASRSRDSRFDGRFFIGVATTGVYCRPICPAPPARRKNVRYFPSAAAAAAAGYRPCLRCRPEAAPGTAAWHGTLAAVRRGLRPIVEGIFDKSPVDDPPGKPAVGPAHLDPLFFHHLGRTPTGPPQTRR